MSDERTDSEVGTARLEDRAEEMTATLAGNAAEAGDEKTNTRRLDSILRIPVVVQAVVGSATLPVSSLLKLGRGAVIQLDHRVGDPVDIVVNGRTFARGEVVVVEEEGARFGVSLTEICEPQSDEANA